jgi:two-component system, OmpR family, alkaline phosphatase synthesis response regulator PhoP
MIISVVGDKEAGILMGANDYLKKPFGEGDLIRKVQSLLGEEKQSILVVDDERAVVESLRVELEAKGYPVSVARDGEEALDFLKIQVPDLVILDVQMPRKNGYEVLSWIRNEPTTRHLPVIMLSAYSLSGERVKLASMGIEAYVEKSMGLATLFEKIDSILKR